MSLLILTVSTLLSTTILQNILLVDAVQVEITQAIFLQILVSLGIIIVACMFTYITQLHHKIRLQMSEYFNLINRMREGVLILTKDIEDI